MSIHVRNVSKRFGSFQPDDVRRLKQLEQENARLRAAQGSGERIGEA